VLTSGPGDEGKGPMPDIVIVGAGLTGLSTAYHLRGNDFLVLEKDDRVGGLCKTEHVDGFSFDYTGHWLHFSTQEARALVQRLLGPSGLQTHQRNAWVYLRGHYCRYPFQANTFGLPVEVVKECLLGFIHAVHQKRKRVPRHFEEWILAQFGRGIGKYFMVPYNTKLWTRHPRYLTCTWMRSYVPRPTLEEVVSGALSDANKALGYNASFSYPACGGIEALAKALAAGIEPRRIQCSQSLKTIDTKHKTIRLRDGTVLPYRKIVATLPLPALVSLLARPSAALLSASRRLAHNSVLNINIGTSRPVGEGRHWVYFPEPGFVFYRVGFPANVNPCLAPEGCGSLSVEIAYRGKAILSKGLRQRVIDDLQRCGVLKSRKEIVAEVALNIPYAYTIYDKYRDRTVSFLRNSLMDMGIFIAGRYGAWEYSAMEDALLWGRNAARWALEF